MELWWGKPLGKLSLVRPAMTRKDNIREIIRKLIRESELDRTDSDHNQWVFWYQRHLTLCYYLFKYSFSCTQFTVTLALTLRTVRPIYKTGVPLPSRCCILYFFFSTTISTEYFKHAAHSPFFSSKCRLFHNATIFWFMYYSHFTYRCAKI
jgi:hypothetical protein